jgi:Fic family protein
MTFSCITPYNNLPFLPPQGVDLETKAILKATIDARAALGELHGMGTIVPNQNLLLRSIALQEARFSSEIENIVTTSDELYRALEHEPVNNPATKEVLRYQEALWHGCQAIEDRPLRISLFMEIVRILKGESMDLRKNSGTRISDGSGGTLYTPPEGEFIIREKLENMEQFLENENGLDPLVKMAVAHYQFEAIHPFVDGNGRTGRIINILYLLKSGLLSAPILYLSRYIIEHKNAYYDGLRRVTEDGDWENWVLYMIIGVAQMARESISKIRDIRQGLDWFANEVRTHIPKVYSLDLVNLLFQQPYCRIRTLEEAGLAKRQTAAQYLQALVDVGLLQTAKAGTQLLFINTHLLTILQS